MYKHLKRFLKEICINVFSNKLNLNYFYDTLLILILIYVLNTICFFLKHLMQLKSLLST